MAGRSRGVRPRTHSGTRSLVGAQSHMLTEGVAGKAGRTLNIRLRGSHGATERAGRANGQWGLP